MSDQKKDEFFSATHKTSLEDLLNCLAEGINYETVLHNMIKARECYRTARNMMIGNYGTGNRLCDFISQYDYIEEQLKGNDRNAILMLADAGNLLYSFRADDIVDEITQWIYENREQILKEIVHKTLMIYHKFDMDFSLERMLPQILMQSGGSQEDILNRMLLDPVNLPHRFQYLFDDILNCMPKGPVNLSDIMPLFQILTECQQKAPMAKTGKEKAELVKRMLDGAKSMYGLTGNSGGFGTFTESILFGLNYDAVRGLYDLGNYEDGDEIWGNISPKKECVEDIVDQIKIKVIECIMALRKGERNKAADILEQALELESTMVIQLFTLRQEKEKLEYLRGIEDILKGILYTGIEASGSEEAYTILLRNRTLAMDFIHSKLNSLEGQRKAAEFLSTFGNEEYQEGNEKSKLREWFDQAEDGILSCQSTDVQKKLSGKQALLEFTIIENEASREFYVAFVVLPERVISINLGKREVIDQYFNKVYEYMETYSKNRYSGCRIKELLEYRKIYEEVLVPLGEVIPERVNELMIVPEGEICRVPFEMLPCFCWYDEFMGDRYEITYLNTGKELLIKRGASAIKESLVIGAPEFGTQEFPDIPAAKHEVETIASLLGTTAYTGKNAAAGLLKKSYRLIHISTHSYRENENPGDSLADPMRQMGLVFADGERLSAREIGGYELTQTELLVLSACNDGNDKLIYNETGIGIRRAFINAGVHHIVMSLWNTDDSAGSLFMEQFYHCYRSGHGTIQLCLRKARQFLRNCTVEELRERYGEREDLKYILNSHEKIDKPYAHPYYWAGYIKIG